MENYYLQPESPSLYEVDHSDLTLLNQAIGAMTTAQDINTTLEQVIDNLNAYLQAESTALLLYNTPSDKLVFSIISPRDTKNLLGTKLPRNQGIANWVLAEKQPIWVENAADHPHFYNGIDLIIGQNTHSLLAVPLLFKEKPIGVIETINRQDRPFNRQDAQVVETVAHAAAIALSNSQLHQESEQQAHQLTVLLELDQAITNSLRLADIYYAFSLHAARLLPYDHLAVMLLDEGIIRLTYITGESIFPLPIGAILPQRNSATGWVISHGQPLLRYNIPTSPRFSEDEQLKTMGLESVISIPLRAKGRVIGAWHLGSKEKVAYHPDDLSIAQSMGDQLAVSVENARLFEQVRAGQEQLRHLAQEIVAAQEKERQRLSRELHDEAGQALTALKIGLELVRADLPAEATELSQRIGESVALTEATMEQLRTLARDLRPPALDMAGLDLTLEGLCREFARRTDLSVSYSAHEVSATPLPDEVNICLYRFVQESLTNVAKHATAAAVEVTLHYNNGTVTVTVQDDGQGFNKPTGAIQWDKPKGIGLLGLQERLQLLGGWLEIDSQPGCGARLVACVPQEAAQ